MKRFGIYIVSALLALFAFVIFASFANAQEPPNAPATLTDEQFIESVYTSTALLYSQNSQGSMEMRCTATVIEKTETGYLLVTAAHCVSRDNEQNHRAEPERGFWFISFDNPGSKDFLAAKLVAVGYQHRGDDFALLSIDTDIKVPVVAIGEDAASHEGEAVLNVASPLGLGKQVFKGHVSSPKLDRPVDANDIHWTGAMLIAIVGVNGGSSGSAIICMKQRAICGNLVGTIGGSSTVAIPVSKLKKFIGLVKAGTYRWYEAAED